MNVVADQPFAGHALRLLGRGRLSLFPQNADGGFEIELCFDQRGAAIGKPRLRAFPQRFHQIRGDIDTLRICGHRSHVSFAFD